MSRSNCASPSNNATSAVIEGSENEILAVPANKNKKALSVDECFETASSINIGEQSSTSSTVYEIVRNKLSIICCTKVDWRLIGAHD